MWLSNIPLYNTHMHKNTDCPWVNDVYQKTLPFSLLFAIYASAASEMDHPINSYDTPALEFHDKNSTCIHEHSPCTCQIVTAQIADAGQLQDNEAFKLLRGHLSSGSAWTRMIASCKDDAQIKLRNEPHGNVDPSGRRTLPELHETLVRLSGGWWWRFLEFRG